MVKEPRPGRVKTRLGRDIGLTTAAWWFRHQTCRLIRRLDDPRWQIILAVSPDREGLQSRIWPEHITRLPQGPGNLGERMARMLRSTPGPTLVIGADIPAITNAHISEAFKALNRNASILGPAPDGGYWLVGLKHPARAPRTLFQDVRWSTEHALEDSAKTLPKPTALTTTLQDVDTAKDL
ncbi:MAG: glycosyltransferase [Boseongicola sp.]|nr:glycosyltransferase [Boseongicola sp.]